VNYTLKGGLDESSGFGAEVLLGIYVEELKELKKRLSEKQIF
jgi:hypothetical protein